MAIAALVALAWLVRGFGQPRHDDQRKRVPALLAGFTALAMGALWFLLIGEVFAPNPVQPFWIAIIAGCAWASLAFALFFGWSSRTAWGKVHRLSAAIGATLACMAAPYLSIATWQKVDVVGVIIFDLIALSGFLFLMKRVSAQTHPSC